MDTKLSPSVNVPISYERKAELWRAAIEQSKLSQINNPGTQRRYKGDGVDSKIRNYIGYLGEQIVATALDIDYEPRIENSSDPGYDLVYNGLKIGVKTKTFYRPDLFVKAKDKQLCDVYIVVRLDKAKGTLRIVGWIESDVVFEAPIGDFMNYGIPCRTVEFEKLKPWEEFEKQYVG